MAQAKTETDTIDMLKDWYQGAAVADGEWRKQALESYQFYTGIRQWDPDIVAALEKAGRPALTINRILPTINLLCGHQRQSRSDITLYARKGGTAPVAALGTELIKHTMDGCLGQYQLSDAFADGLICGKGWIETEVVYTEDPDTGELEVRKVSPFSMLEDQANLAYDLNRGSFVFKVYWMDRRELELQYPKKAADLPAATEASDWAGEGRQVEDDRLDYEETAGIEGGGETDEDRHGRQYRVRECWYKRYERVLSLVHLPTMNLRRLKKRDVPTVKAAIIRQPELRQEFRLVERISPVLHQVVVVGDTVLEQKEDPLEGIVRFPFFRYCPYWVDGFVFGVVENLKGAQRELNKRRSQVLHNANQTANSGWKVAKKGNDEAMRKLEQYGSTPGVTLDESDYGGKFDKIEPNKLDQAHFLLAEKAGDDIKEISGVNPDLTGTNPHASESGKARIVRQTAGLMVSEIVFDNFDRTQAGVGEFLWEIIRTSDVYSEQEITAVAQESSLKDFLRTDEATGEVVVDLSPLRNWDQGRYGVRVAAGKAAPTVRIAQFEQMLEAVKAGLPIPARFLIELSDLPNKEQILEELRALSQTQAKGAAQGAVA